MITIFTFFFYNINYIDSVIKSLKYIYRCCGLFALEIDFQIFAMNDCLIYNSVISKLLVISNIDSCSIFEDGTYLCFTCKKLFLLRNRPKFEILNNLLYADCHSYSLALADLSMAKKATIVCAHPVIFILKIRPSKTFNLVAYSGIKGYTVLFLQNLSFLLILFPFPTLALYDVIRIVWARRRRFINFDL